MRSSAFKLAASLVLLLGFTQVAALWAERDSPSQGTQPSESQPKVKSGGIDDIDAIGNREIGGRGLGNWYSLETEIRIGREYAQMVESSVKLVADPVIREYVNRLGQNIVRNSDSRLPFTIKVIDASEVNAFVLPGGYFY